jgi:N-acetylmuramic acid 6-phosphate etherase
MGNDGERTTPLLGTEDRSPRTQDIDQISVAAGLELLSQEFRRAFETFEARALDLGPIVEAVIACVRDGGGVHLFGAGTSGRMAALDAAEVPPTFGVSTGLFHTHLAGGPAAMTTAVEDAEDDANEGASAGDQVEMGDVAIGLTASGRTPFVIAALAAAKKKGAFTALIDCNRPGSLEVDCELDCHVTLETGAEPITGSTRLNAATAQKLALNAVSTLAMVHLGRTYSNFMVCLQPKNSKLRNRLTQTLADISGATRSQVQDALVAAGNEGDVALVMLKHGWDAHVARSALAGRTALRPIIDGAPTRTAPGTG